jgi:hypothetical protein
LLKIIERRKGGTGRAIIKVERGVDELPNGPHKRLSRVNAT